MGIADDTTDGIKGVLNEAWSITTGTVVPASDDIVLKNGGRRLDATYLYADLANSSQLAQRVSDEIAAKVIRAYLNAATRLLRYYKGQIRSFDGDRVMAIFVGTSKNTQAVKAAYAINWAVQEVIRGKLDAKWPQSLKNYTMQHGIGVDTGEALIVRGGVRNNNDLVSVGSAPNVAAKLSDLRNGYSIHVSSSVHDVLHESVKVKLDGSTNVWTSSFNETVGGKTVAGKRTDYWRKAGS